MEQLNQLYDANVAESFFSIEETSQDIGHGIKLGHKQIMTHSELHKFILKLLTTIDLPKLAKLYFQQLQSSLPLSELKIQFEDNCITEGKGVENAHMKSLNCEHFDSSVAVVDYAFTHPLSLTDWQILQQMHVNFCYPLKNALEHHKIKQCAMKDVLTSLGNRASYNETMGRLESQSQRHYQPFGLLVLDMDNFKQVNDTHGHLEGDEVLVACGQTIIQSLRESDFSFRLGGDEFCCLLPEADEQTSNLIAERIRGAIQSNLLLQSHNISCSIGSATFQKQDSQIGIFSRADQALYAAKEAGKNCIRAA
ncbi:GGDEF domain-containing protein [uncultured Paraglaciecola sp.]|uniref:GGDEF domain-containing protein n=1 Tax=uncultured Paraglaciecola sp. TaxID=1765024 RepID=UPI002620B439|nr:GGDEF domain-containing protein [uncultured Paraglaciecola sp.]